MSRDFPDGVATVGNDLTRIAGSYLHSVTQGSWQACAVCALPVDGYQYCPQCQSHRQSGSRIAERVGLLVYAEEPSSQTYRVMHGYKQAPTRAGFEPIVEALLAVGLRGHFACANALAGTDDSGWAVVPSTKSRDTLASLVRGLTRSPDTEVAVHFAGPAPDRDLRPDAWTLPPGADLPRHVVVIDDSWVSGASSQSLAAALTNAGVEQVSILVVARVLSPRWGPNRPFLNQVLPTLAYEWTICPWTRGACPVL